MTPDETFTRLARELTDGDWTGSRGLHRAAEAVLRKAWNAACDAIEAKSSQRGDATASNEANASKVKVK